MAKPSKPWFRASKQAWYIKVGGKQISLGVKGRENEADAVKAWHRLMANGQPKPEAKPDDVSVAEVVTAFLADAKSRVQPITLAFYRRFLLPFAECHSKLKADALTPTLVEAYSRKPTWSSSTRHDCLGTLATAFKWAERARLIDRSPLTGIRLPPKESQGAEALVNEADYGKLLNATKGDFNALLRFLWHTGCRPSEATGLTVEAVDWASACIVLKRHKTAHKGKMRVIYLSPDAQKVLNVQREKYGAGYLFRTAKGNPWARKVVAHKLWRLQRKLGVKVTAYGFRHTFATDALANGVPDAQVAALLGHSTTAMLHRHYAHLTERAQALRSALTAVRPPAASNKAASEQTGETTLCAG